MATALWLQGGGIDSDGPLTLREVVVSGNTSRAINGVISTEAYSGGVAAFNATTVVRSTISGNVVESTSGSGIVIANIGGIDFDGEAGLLDRSTVSGNSLRISGGAADTQSIGGGVTGGAGLTISGSTITANSVAATAKAALGANVSLTNLTIVRDTIVSNPLGAPNCLQPPTSQGFNIEDGNSCGFGQPTDLPLTAPGLDPELADNGGPTPTHALLPGSVAIDGGRAFGAGTDQRGLPRPSDFAAIDDATSGDGSDVGAFELQAPAQSQGPPAPQESQPPADTEAPGTRIVRRPPHLTASRRAGFRFAADEAGAHFQCRLDQGPFRGCRSPWRRAVRAGARHVFQVRAVDAAGNLDRTPARFAWRVRRQR